MKRKILIIEDNEQNMYLMTFLLESYGFEIVQAYNGRDGIRLAKEFEPKVILLDIQLPDLNGYQVAEELRKDHALAGVPIIAVTSFAMAGDKARAVGAGGTGYIKKPINPDTFIFQLQEYLSAV
ncbi:MAG: response regulator [Ignavibacteriae bacterium]|nr:MAG: response regulator [Ignavibacteriota bacterium]